MRYVLLPSFKADYKRLSPREQEHFKEAVRQINTALERRGDRRLPHWPAALRVKSMEGVPGIWEMTWSFTGPDGRATFEIVEIEGEPAIRWRRIGGHRIFQEP